MTEKPTFQRPHVLIVSDDLGLSQFLAEGLLVAGFWTSVIASAIQTIEVFRLRTFDLVIVDAALDGLGAEELIRRLLGGGPSTPGVSDRPVVLVAATREEFAEASALELGVSKLVVAPIEIEELAIELFTIVSGWRAEHPDALWADDAAQQ